ncbi:MAG: hypothetical protein COZ06_24340 [Armatimonadetes bacterium CG_4_10_14_3_um_filter_66_18]|nr:sulfatase [Armatimonadota bacterium]OIP04774.1 MAG: hypothetical protein AUJ96_11960 [Armatimonadetes bacterium CG2_30_66_41]PIU90573.1 MAG: hypothetical protein COS65_24725 [Armatimonadetes bacterium CG06_land_8_20_14_3_00_66_21]PIX42008.1 MAG: hypothetical protein COZ57_22180 [Armatimonadetes bacterium CG_4_8_14_3_um_filter_66_20]PIY42830.1 MAG: hypothetical protein COZ06_24340 [Armatimonadetes bacterium CG_4_10_14_3_um_filter_66_18]PJB74860.1 MAG: hypothetical protein CO096_02850 [Armati
MNAIVLCLDTLRWDALGCYRDDWVQTPNIDHYAQKATRLDAAYCASFPTVPMRVDAYTGAVNWPRYGWRGPDDDQPKLPQVLREAGYHTGLVLDTGNNVGAGLHKFYDEHYLITKEVDDGLKAEEIVVPVPLEHVRQQARQYKSQRAEWAHFKHETDWFVARTMLRASQWLEDNAHRDKWFLWVDTFEIHEDYMPPKYYVALYDPGYTGPDYTFPNYGYTDIYTPETLHHLRSCYAGEVTLTDRWVGHLLRQVELMGLFEDTCVILTSDHGMYLGEHNRCGKHTVNAADPWPIYDTVGRLPILAWTPFENQPQTLGALCQAADLMPTVLDLCGVDLPPTTGKSWAPALRGEPFAGHDRVYTTFHGHQGGMPSQITVTTPTHTALFGRRPHEPELYDRGADPDQLNNLAADRYDLVASLRADLVAFMEGQGADDEYIRAYAKGE